MLLALLFAANAAAAGPELAKLWSAPLPGQPLRSCAVTADSVFQGVSRVVDKKERGAIVAVDRKTGAVRWQRDLGAAGIQSAPLVLGELVLHGAFHGEAQALDVKTGAVRWRADTRGGGLHSTPVVDGDAVWLGYLGGALKVEPATGKELLRIPIAAGTSVLGVRDGRVFLHDMAANQVVAFDAKSGARLWSLDGPVIDRERHVSAGFQPEGAALDATTLYLPTNVAETWAVELGSGKKRWRDEPGPSGSFGTVLGLGGSAIFLTSSNQADSVLVRVDSATGAESWRQPMAGIVHALPVLVGERVAVPTGGGKLRVFGARDGEPVGELKLGAAWWQACAADGVVYVGHERKRLSAVRVAPQGP
ncbi:MAG: PQQ-binding-like beta-propeller repeat protein [Deltaproteobacteria bacterium]|nr:PQQ-binding-like beta-propeller repeat protein [Deltaproteobacteria bacterium]